MKLASIFAGVASTVLTTSALAASSLVETVATAGLSTVFGAAVGLAAGLWIGYKMANKEPGGDGSAKVGLVLISGGAGCAVGAALGLGAGALFVT